ncbi:MAG: carboxymuconolactone decarboxylase family protein [Prolixibacteraceae bacterium]|jgi:AhpD family alkylhydroperoxidase|nr:carboxymuconolactone decarboxylase family protein [Prolixibacteraceae bacterium]
MNEKITEFRAYREKMNEKILAADNKVMKRIYNIDTNTYMEGALSTKVKEMMGLVCSMVLRCDDCVKYHLEKCHEQGVTTEELFEIFAVANLVGGSIVIPHTRRAVEYWEALREEV